MDQTKSVLKQYWGYDSFRPLQQEIIDAVLEGKDTLALLPTGGGKSICFQVPALCLPGLCLVVTPLIALMKDQVEQLKKRGIRASAIYSGMPRREIDIILDNCVYGKVKFLYVSPERLKTDIFQARVEQMEVSLLAIDEAHCISQWGYDFRPAYLDIAGLYPLLGHTRKIALTATATKEVKQDILDKLAFEKQAVFQKSFARKNLSYSVFELENKEQKMLDILQKVGGTAIVYVRSRKETQRITTLLNQRGISAAYYHAGLTVKERTAKQQQWIGNQVRVMVATNAFGMGIDKPDVRVVIHLDLPDSLEAYYQEAGRAGRDERNAYAVLLYSQADIHKIKENFSRSFPSIDFIKRVYQSLANYYKLAVGSSQWQNFDFQVDDFARSYQLNPFDAFYAIKKLEEYGLILLSESFYKPSVAMFSISHEDLYRYCIANARMEPILKALLRLYGGEMYSELKQINENDLARMVKAPAVEVVKTLEFLHKNDILVYDKTKEKPQLTFLTPRQDATQVKIPKVEYEARRNQVEEKLLKMVTYATDRLHCRTRIFQEYFDEETYLNCGVCDRCIQEKKKRNQGQEVSEVTEKLKNAIDQEWKSLHVLQREVAVADSFAFAEMIRGLVDRGEVEVTTDGQVRRCMSG